MLDVSIRLEILNLLDRLKRDRNLAMLYVTHNLATARHFSAEIMVMYRGGVVERGPSNRVILNPAHPYAQVLASARRPRPTASRQALADARRGRQAAQGRAWRRVARGGARPGLPVPVPVAAAMETLRGRSAAGRDGTRPRGPVLALRGSGQIAGGAPCTMPGLPARALGRGGTRRG